jgi:GH15 family glucan-1,4-alpha-glucosidase
VSGRGPAGPLRIEDHGVVGDLHTVALVGIDGAIDFLCLPSFESPSIFASLLDPERGGYFKIAPVLDDADRRQLYLPDSNILLTRFLSAEGVAEISDLMTVEAPEAVTHNVVRRAKTVRGEIRFRMECRPRFDYGRAHHTVERRGERCLLFHVEKGGPTFALHASVPLVQHGGDAMAEFTLRPDESADFVLELMGDGGSPCERDGYVAEAFKETLNYWRAWIGRSTYRGRWREMVNRSALVLKLLGSCRHGSFVAAPTFGLPEVIGGVRNWDYRFTWIRDTSFILYALLRLGYTDEAAAFMDWIAERCGDLETGASLQVLYGIDGKREVDEIELAHLSGYRGSRPVRIGNAAYHQLQLDIYGELMDAVYLYDKFGEPISIDLWKKLRHLLAWLAGNWQQPDEGIWETRGGRIDFLYSRVLCWVAFDRAIRMARRRSLPAPLDEWHGIRDTIHADILDNFWCERLGAFVQQPGTEILDASALVMPLMRFIGPRDPRWLGTLAAIEERLVEDSLVHRYRIDGGFPDGLEGKEGTFSLCSFWYVECVSRAGDLQKARLAFEKMLGYANHVGLYAEELGPSGEHLGNFPQAFTHVGLISAAYDLDRRLERSGEG